MADPRLTDLARSLPRAVPFVPPEAQERDRRRAFRARLGANESAFGPSPHAVETMRAMAGDAWMYPDSAAFELREALSAHHGIDPGHITVGNGIDGILGTLVRLLVTPGTPVVTSAGAYPTFNYHVTGFGGVIHTVPYRDDHEDPVALIDKAREVGAKLIYLSNPDNPMGSWHDPETVQRMIDAVPEGALLVLDEAYVECTAGFAAPDWAPDDPRVIRTRTFSKAYGLAGLRVGYAVGPRDLIADFDLVRDHFGVSRVAQAAARASLDDAAWLIEVQARIVQSRARLAAIAHDNGLVALPSATNFVAIDSGGDGAFAARVNDALVRRDVFIRCPGTAPLDRILRISCGPEDEMRLVAEALPQALAEAHVI